MTRNRVVQIALGYLAACAGSVLVCMIPALPLVPFMFGGPAGPFFPLILIGGVAAFALVPSVIAISIAERRGVRSRRAHLAFGALIGICALVSAIFGQWAYWGYDPIMIQLYLYGAPFGAIPGAIGGLIYRATAGREAGSDGSPSTGPSCRG